MLQFIGRLHPLLLHLPIGILVLSFIIFLLQRQKKNHSLYEALGIILKIGMWSAIFVAISGYLLAQEGGYDDELVFKHQWFGIGTAVLSVIVFILYKKGKSKALFPGMIGMMIVLLITGHLGGSLTHGSDFLLEPFQPPEPDEMNMASVTEARLFDDLIKPVFKDKCNRCHNDSKLKGDLLLSSVAGIKNGGKTGPLYITGDANNSLIMKRIHLPVEEKKHMPPKGKKQLTKDEIRLLEWWIQTGAEYESSISEFDIPDDIKSILNKYFQPETDVFTLQIEPASERSISKLKSLGVQVEPLIKDKPFLSASLKGRNDVDQRLMRQLKAISTQLISLDLSKTNVDDQMLKGLGDMQHLQKLNLQNTNLSGNVIKTLSELEYLQYLNLVNTRLEDQYLNDIARISGLKDVYLWNTNTTDAEIQNLQEKRPRLNINRGVNKEIFGSAQLKPPIIQAEKDIFSDSLEVTFDINFKNVNLYYSLDGSKPDSTSFLYESPFPIYQTTEIQVIAQKKGWQASDAASRIFIRSKYQPTKVTLNRKPHPNYPGEGSKSLTDFVKGTTIFRDGNWLGYEKQNFTATFDMGDIVDISRITVSALESTDQWIFFPKGFEISLSENGTNYKKVKSSSYPIAPGPEPPSMKNFSESIDPAKARYIKIQILSHLVNPAWHPASGQPSWVFIDEVMIE